jgi:hypothetical protein
MTALAKASSHCKRQTRPLVRESAPHQQTGNCLTVITIWSQAPDWCFIPRQTGRLTVGCNIRLRLRDWVRVPSRYIKKFGTRRAKWKVSIVSKLGDVPVSRYQIFWTNKRSTLKSQYQSLVQQCREADAQLKIVYVRVSYSERFPRYSYFTVQYQNCWQERDITYCFWYRYLLFKWQSWYILPTVAHFRNVHRQHQCTLQLVWGHHINM